MKRLARRMTLLAAPAVLLSACVYRMPIQQGNYLVTESVSQLKEGMTRSQVRFLLGTPMVPDAFNDARWDYYYFYSSRVVNPPSKRRLTVYFVDDKVDHFENQGVPTKTDITELERQLKKAQAETRKNRKSPGLFKRMFTRDKEEKPAEKTDPAPASESGAAPAVPAAPAEPAPAAPPSGQP